MFQKVHLKLTLLCAGITIFILLVMSCGWLYVSEKSLRDNSFISFQNDMNTLISNLEQQTVISGEWLKNMEDNGKYLIWILDNGVPFPHNLCMSRPGLPANPNYLLSAALLPAPQSTQSFPSALKKPERTIMPAAQFCPGARESFRH